MRTNFVSLGKVSNSRSTGVASEVVPGGAACCKWAGRPSPGNHLGHGCREHELRYRPGSCPIDAESHSGLARFARDDSNRAREPDPGGLPAAHRVGPCRGRRSPPRRRPPAGRGRRSGTRLHLVAAARPAGAGAAGRGGCAAVSRQAVRGGRTARGRGRVRRRPPDQRPADGDRPDGGRTAGAVPPVDPHRGHPVGRDVVADRRARPGDRGWCAGGRPGRDAGGRLGAGGPRRPARDHRLLGGGRVAGQAVHLGRPVPARPQSVGPAGARADRRPADRPRRAAGHGPRGQLARPGHPRRRDVRSHARPARRLAAADGGRGGLARSRNGRGTADRVVRRTAAARGAPAGPALAAGARQARRDARPRASVGQAHARDGRVSSRCSPHWP